jgi:tetratricopeptide (TPR) repeat protein
MSVRGVSSRLRQLPTFTALLVLLGFVLSAGAAAQAGSDPSRRADRVGELIARGRAFEQRGDPSTATGYFRDAISSGPRDPRGYRALGESYLALREWARALEVFEAGVQAAPGAPELWLGLSRSARALDRPLRALEALRAALARQPDAPETLAALAELGAELGLWSSALASTRALLALAERRPDESLDMARLKLNVRALELVLGSAERARHHPCPGASAVVSALARCP